MGKPGEASVTEVAAEVGPDALQYADKGPMLFDFSKLRRASEGLFFIDAPGATEESSDDNALAVGLVGDALLEPFWPEGLGIVRGLYSALDVSSAIVRWSGGDSREATRQHFSAAYGQLKTLSAATRASVLRPNEASYGLDPSTRYRSLTSSSVRATTATTG